MTPGGALGQSTMTDLDERIMPSYDSDWNMLPMAPNRSNEGEGKNGRRRDTPCSQKHPMHALDRRRRARGVLIPWVSSQAILERRVMATMAPTLRGSAGDRATEAWQGRLGAIDRIADLVEVSRLPQTFKLR